MRALIISTIILGVAAIMVFSSAAPALQQAFAHNVPAGDQDPSGNCPVGFTAIVSPSGQHPDHNANGIVCEKIICPGQPPGPGRCDRTTIKITIDDLP